MLGVAPGRLGCEYIRGTVTVLRWRSLGGGRLGAREGGGNGGNGVGVGFLRVEGGDGGCGGGGGVS